MAPAAHLGGRHVLGDTSLLGSCIDGDDVLVLLHRHRLSLQGGGGSVGLAPPPPLGSRLSVGATDTQSRARELPAKLDS